MKAIQEADSLCNEFDNLTDDEYPEWEDLDYVPKEVFEKNFNKDYYKAEENIDYGDISLPEIIFEWNEDDEDSIRKVCPKTFEKWWDNDKF